MWPFPPLVPQEVTSFVINEAIQTSATRVMFVIEWIKPSDRNGSFHYSLQFEAEQLSPYPEARRESVNLMTQRIVDGNQQNFIFEGALPYATYTITLTAVNTKLNRPGPSVSMKRRTIAIGNSMCISFNIQSCNYNVMYVSSFN